MEEGLQHRKLSEPGCPPRAITWEKAGTEAAVLRRISFIRRWCDSAAASPMFDPPLHEVCAVTLGHNNGRIMRKWAPGHRQVKRPPCLRLGPLGLRGAGNNLSGPLALCLVGPFQ